MADHRHIGLVTGRDTRIATVIMKAVPDNRRLSLIPKFIPYLLVFVLVSLPSESWAREINPEISEIQNENAEVNSEDSSIVIQPVISETQSNDEKSDVREQKTILSELPDKIQEVVQTRIVDESVSIDQADKGSENVDVQSNDEGIRRFDVEIQPDEEQPLNDGQVIESSDESDKVTIKGGDSESVKSARDDSARNEGEEVVLLDKKEENIAVESEKPSEEALALKKTIEERNPFLKKFLLSKQEGEEQREDEGEEEEQNIRKLRDGSDKKSDIIQRIKEKALQLQEEIKNTTFLEKLKKQDSEVLPEIPPFTEEQLLKGLKLVVSNKKQAEFNESVAAFNASELTPVQQEILKCAEELLTQRQRQSFISNMYQCIRGLSVMNCMRIFVYPVLIENVPQSLANNFPIEINIADIFQGNRIKNKSVRRENFQSNELLSPEWQIYTILRNMLKSYPANEKNELYVDIKNETLASILTPKQILILQMGENLLPEAIRQEYANQMFSCIRRFEYYSCIKYFAWPMIKHYLPMLPEFPAYYWTPPVISEYPEIIPYPASPLEVPQLPEIIDADGTRTRGPKPELVILGILQNTLRDQQNYPPHPSFVDYARVNPRISQEQLESFRIAEQLLPASARPDYAAKTLSCINQYNYLHCIKHSTWPTVRKYSNIPKLPELQSLIGNYNIPSLSGYIPGWSTLPSLSSLFNKPHHIFGGGSGASGGSGGGAAGGGGGSGSGSGSGGGIGIGGGSGGGAGSGGSDPSGAGQLPGIPGIGGAGIGGSGPGFIPPYPFIPVIPYPWLTQQINDPSQAGAGSGSQGGGYPGSGSGTGGVWGPWGNGTQGGVGSGTGGASTGGGSGAGSAPITGGGSAAGSNDPAGSGQGSGSGAASGSDPSGAATSEPSDVPAYPQLPCRSNFKLEEIHQKYLTDWEDEIIQILRKARDSISNITETSSMFEKSKIPLSLTIRQLTILRLSEDLLPMDLMLRQDITTKLLECLEERNLFANCLRIIMFPVFKEYVPTLPKLPSPELSRGSGRADDEANIREPSISHSLSQPKVEKLQVKKTNEPVISVTGTRFVPIFTEHPESVIYNILQSIRLTDLHPVEKTSYNHEQFPELSKVLSERQEKILLSAAELIPNKSREEFINKTLMCAIEHAFLNCARTIIWPFVHTYVPELPSFPNFEDTHQKKSHVIANAPTSLDPTETNVEAKKHGEHHITITDTRFVPVLSEQPETVVLKILKAAQLSVPNLSTRISTESLVDKHSYAHSLSPEQLDILKTSETLLPESVRAIFVTRMLDCVEHSVPFLDCTRDIAFPAISQFHPNLPSFPYSGNSLKAKLGVNVADKNLQTEIENALRHTSAARSDWDFRHGQINAESSRAFYSYPILSDQQVNIIKLSESLLPESVRITYRSRMVDCIRTDSFLTCTQRNWPILKQFVPSLPDFASSNNLYSTPAIVPLSSLPHISQFPQLSPLPSIPEITFNNELRGLPTVVNRRTVLPYDPNRLYRQMQPVNEAAPTLVGER